MRPTLIRLGLVAALAVALLAVAGVTVRSHTAPPAARTAARPVDPPADRVARAQQPLRDVPGDWGGWATFGATYLEQARVTADPALYPLAEQAAGKSLKLHRDGNGSALVVLGALANARH